MSIYIKCAECVPGIPGGDAGGSYVPHYIQYGGGHSVPTLGSGGAIEIRRAGRYLMRRMTPNHTLLRE